MTPDPNYAILGLVVKKHSRDNINNKKSFLIFAKFRCICFYCCYKFRKAFYKSKPVCHKTIFLLQFSIFPPKFYKALLSLRCSKRYTFLDMYNINAVGALRVCKGLWNAFHPGSVIINISSEAGSVGASERKQEYAYCMSKAAMNMGAKILSNELAERQVKVVNLHPGWMRTVMGGALAAQMTDLSVSPEKSAEDIVAIALDAPNFPDNITYMEHTRKPLPW